MNAYVGVFVKFDTSTPSIKDMIVDLFASGHSLRSLAKYSGVSESTLKRYIKSDRSPKAIRMALFWICSWGRHHMHIDITNEARAFTGLARALQSQNDALRASVQTLEQDLREVSTRCMGGVSHAANERFFQPDVRSRSTRRSDHFPAETTGK